MLRCPNCHAELKREGKAFRCRNGHSFDVARQGYVNLLVNARRETGDNKEMVSARTAFLEQGHYRCLRDALCEIIRSLPVQVIADCGCGEGYYTQAAAEEGKDVYAFDMSKYALMKCARRHPAIHAFAASIYDLPLDEACADMVMSIFAPFGADEFLRVLKPGGYVLKVEPAHDHLLEMKQAKGTDLSRYEVIVFGGGIYASGIAGLNALKKQLAHLSPQKVVIFCVGASPYDEQALAAIKEHNMDGPLKDLPLFYCRGGWDMPAMSFIDRNLCKMLKKATAKKDPSSYEPWERALMEAGEGKCDWSDQAYLKPILDEIDR